MSALNDTAASRLASFAVETPTDAIPRAVRARAKLHLLDTVGCGLAAAGTGVANHATAIAIEQGGRAEASLVGESVRVPAALAALANGTRCHGLDFDDTHEGGICHASTVVAPAALAIGETRGRTGREVLDAYVLGCEVAVRIALPIADELYARGFHPTSVCGGFGAAAATCRLLGLEVQETTRALGVVGSFAAGLFEYLTDGSDTKPLHAGWAAHSGVQAARLAEAGASGPPSVIEGPFGLMASHAGRVSDATSISDRLGQHWEAANSSIKPFPACHFVHSSTWAAAQLSEEHRLGHDDIAEIIVRIPPEGVPVVLKPETVKTAPRTPYDAKFSLPFAVAHHLVHGHLGLTAFSPPRIQDQDVLTVAARVRFESITAGDGPASRFAGGARVITRAGDEWDRFVAHAPGSPQNPLDEEWVLSKFRSNAELSLDPDSANELMDALRSLDEADSLERPMALSRAAARRLETVR
jgi:2-methylcitrate dehydratase PrpD